MSTNIIGFLVTVFVAALVPALFILLATFLGPKKSTPEKLMPFECGVISSGTQFKRFPVKFYVVAMMFLIFDLESAALYLWTILFRDLNFFGFLEMLLFVAILVVGLIYAWNEGGLEWE